MEKKTKKNIDDSYLLCKKKRKKHNYREKKFFFSVIFNYISKIYKNLRCHKFLNQMHESMKKKIKNH